MPGLQTTASVASLSCLRHSTSRQAPTSSRSETPLRSEGMKGYTWLLLIVGWLIAVQGEAAPAYEIQDLGNVLPQGINAEGVVAGSVVLAAQQAVVILPDGTLKSLGFLPNGNFSQA